jgi:predicted transcriptional regulator
MSDSEPKTTVGETTTTVPEMPPLDLVTVLFALGSEVRWPIVKLLADGTARNISDIRAVAGSTAENISKQLRVLQNAGILEGRKGDDRRQQIFSVPAAYRATPGRLDFGCCTVKL